MVNRAKEALFIIKHSKGDATMPRGTIEQNKKEIDYRRWDDSVFHLQLTPIKEANSVYEIEATRQHDPSYDDIKSLPSYGRIRFETKDERRVLVLCDNENNETCIDAQSFYEHIEMSDNDIIKGVTINSIEEYIAVIKAYRFTAFMLKIEELLGECQKLCGKHIENEIEREVASKEWEKIWSGVLQQAGRFYNKVVEQITAFPDLLQREEYKVLESAFLSNAEEAVKRAREIEGDVLENLHERDAIIETARQVGQQIRLYKGGENFMYFRGLGKIIYPEQANVFRDERKYDEDRLYKNMKVSFPNELSDLRYLDRLAKLQHYELPTRMLDVTSNPLVALYMACNTIYTGDPNQEDWGEVVLYFNKNQKERAYDSKALLIVAALVKLSYAEKADMYKFIRIHEEYIEAQQKTNPSCKRNIQQVLNECIHLACEYNPDEVLPEWHQRTLDKWIKNVSTNIDTSKCETPLDYCWACMQGAKKPYQNRNWRCVGGKAAAFSEPISARDYAAAFKDFVLSYDRLLVTVRRENPAFQNKIDVFSLIPSYHGQFGMTNDRILAQSGSFIISGLDNQYVNKKMTTSRSKGFCRIIIGNKKRIYQELCLLNITDATMLPDMAHRAHYLLGQLKENK